MDNHKPVSDRIRPILQAMERSIDSARRNRVKEPSPAAATYAPAAVHQSTHTPLAAPPRQPQPNHLAQHQHLQPHVRSNHESLSHPTIGSPSAQPQAPAAAPGVVAPAIGRLKAKPKRINSPFSSPFDQAVFRTQTG